MCPMRANAGKGFTGSSIPARALFISFLSFSSFGVFQKSLFYNDLGQSGYERFGVWVREKRREGTRKTASRGRMPTRKTAWGTRDSAWGYEKNGVGVREIRRCQQFCPFTTSSHNLRGRPFPHLIAIWLENDPGVREKRRLGTRNSAFGYEKNGAGYEKFGVRVRENRRRVREKRRVLRKT